MNIDTMIEKWHDEFAFCEEQENNNLKNKEYITAHNHAVRKEQIREFIKDLKQVKNNFVLADVIGRSEQFICPDCNKTEKEYRDGLCEMCHKWHTG